MTEQLLFLSELFLAGGAREHLATMVTLQVDLQCGVLGSSILTVGAFEGFFPWNMYTQLMYRQTICSDCPK